MSESAKWLLAYSILFTILFCLGILREAHLKRELYEKEGMLMASKRQKIFIFPSIEGERLWNMSKGRLPMSKIKVPAIGHESLDLTGPVRIECAICNKPVKIVDAKQGLMKPCECWLIRAKDRLLIHPQFRIIPKEE